MTTISPKTLHDLGWAQLLRHLAERCHTERGQAHALALELVATPEEARQRIALVTEMRLLHDVQEPPSFAGIQDIESPTAHADKEGILTGSELIAVAETVAGCARLRRHLVSRGGTAPGLAAIAGAITELSHVSAPILDSFEEGGRLADHASAALGPLRRSAAALRDQLSQRAYRLLDDPAIAPHLSDRFTTQRDDRYVLPVRADARARIKGIVHGASQSGQTVYVEPEEIVLLNNRLKIAEADVAAEEHRILRDLTSAVRLEAPAIRAGVVAATELDGIDAAAQLATALSASAPDLSTDGRLDLRRARHPLLVLSGRACVANDVALPPRTALVISGPNAGGKTVVLKTTGLIALMARAGLHVPCDAPSCVPFYRSICSDIGDDQSLERDLSTFSAHLTGLAALLHDGGESSLLLLDEVAVGTEPSLGAALAQAVLETLVAGGAQILATTHYERLKVLATKDARFMNAAVGFDAERLVPTFRLHVGVPGASGALALARRLGFPDALLARADALLGDGAGRLDGLVASLEAERRRLEDEADHAATTRRHAEGLAAEAEATRREAATELRRLRRGAHDEAIAELGRARNELHRLRTALAKGPTAVVSTAQAEVERLAGTIAAHAPPPEAPAGLPIDPSALRPGASVIVASLGGRGVVLAPPVGGRVAVQVGGLRTTARVDELTAAPSHDRAAPARVSPPRVAPVEVANTAPAPLRTADATADLRGLRVDEALAEVDRFLDDALRSAHPVVFLLHGHGTGALKAAVREHLVGHLAVARFTAAAPREGGDGVTAVWLDVAES